jgi:hypothetical protein
MMLTPHPHEPWRLARYAQVFSQPIHTERHAAQVLAVVTVGNDLDGLTTDTLHGPQQKPFIAHYACPSYAVNEARPAMTCFASAWCP